jgi:hypothetical protein
VLAGDIEEAITGMPLVSKNMTLERNGMTAHRKKKEYARTEMKNRR